MKGIFPSAIFTGIFTKYGKGVDCIIFKIGSGKNSNGIIAPVKIRFDKLNANIRVLTSPNQKAVQIKTK